MKAIIISLVIVLQYYSTSIGQNTSNVKGFFIKYEYQYQLSEDNYNTISAIIHIKDFSVTEAMNTFHSMLYRPDFLLQTIMENEVILPWDELNNKMDLDFDIYSRKSAFMAFDTFSKSMNGIHEISHYKFQCINQKHMNSIGVRYSIELTLYNIPFTVKLLSVDYSKYNFGFYVDNLHVLANKLDKVPNTRVIVEVMNN